MNSANEPPILKEVSNHIRYAKESQLKFAYFFIGLSVASIGYSINQTLDKKLIWMQLPLWIAIFLFFLSIVFGFSYIRILLASMNIDIKNIQDYNEIEADFELTNDEKYDKQLKIYYSSKKSSEEMTKRNKVNYQKQKLAFLGAIVSFVIWRIIEMYHLM